MNIVKATKEAVRLGIGITNQQCKKSGVYLLPTNTDECFLVIPVGCKFPETSGRVAPRWNPKARDILSDDWELSAKKA